MHEEGEVKMEKELEYKIVAAWMSRIYSRATKIAQHLNQPNPNLAVEIENLYFLASDAQALRYVLDPPATAPQTPPAKTEEGHEA